MDGDVPMEPQLGSFLLELSFAFSVSAHGWVVSKWYQGPRNGETTGECEREKGWSWAAYKKRIFVGEWWRKICSSLIRLSLGKEWEKVYKHFYYMLFWWIPDAPRRTLGTLKPEPVNHRTPEAFDFSVKAKTAPEGVEKCISKQANTIVQAAPSQHPSSFWLNRTHRSRRRCSCFMCSKWNLWL